MNNLHKTQDTNNPIPNTNTNNTKSKKSYFFCNSISIYNFLYPLIRWI